MKLKNENETWQNENENEIFENENENEIRLRGLETKIETYMPRRYPGAVIDKKFLIDTWWVSYV